MTFRLRVFLLVMLVALLAIGTTAWLTLTVAARRVTASTAAAQRSTAEITAILERYGRTHGTWAGIGDVLDVLSAKYAQRIRVETFDGEVVVDTDASAGQATRPVVSSPSPVHPRAVLPEAEISANPIPAHPVPANAANPVPPEAVPFHPSIIVMRAADLIARYRTSMRTIDCMNRAAGFQGGYAIDDTSPYLPTTLPPIGRLSDDGAVVQALRTCQEQSRTRPGDTQADRAALARCDPASGLSDPDADVTALVTAQAVECVRAAFERRTQPLQPVPLQLYVGAADYGPAQLVSRESVIAVGVILLLAVGGTSVLARRLSRPVGLLTSASQDLADGNLRARVPVSGKDELARLSQSFNQMAEALEASERRQQQLTADVAHELRTPLSNLRGYLEGLQDGVVQPSPELFASLHAETELQRRILDDLQVLALAETRSLTYHRERTNVAELLQATANAHRAVATEAGVDLCVDTPAALLVDADQHRIRQVLGNLVSNAIRHTSRGGLVTIRGWVTRDGATLAVQDTGCGIPAEDLPHVFDRFWRADPARQRATGGSGLGLTIARRIVQDHGGDIEVFSTVDVGTTFTVTLPLAPGTQPG